MGGRLIMKVYEVLQKIYAGEIEEDKLKKLPKEELSDFILEVFNKGLLNNYCDLK